VVLVQLSASGYEVNFLDRRQGRPWLGCSAKQKLRVVPWGFAAFVGPKYSMAGLKEVLLLFEVVMESRRSSGASQVLMLIGEGSGWTSVGRGVVDTRVSGRYRSEVPVGGEVTV
jgi:hypothetical protein